MKFSKLLTGFIIVLGIAFLVNPKTVEACSACFYGDPDSTVILSLKMGVLSLMGILLLVMGAFISFFISVTKRSQLMEQRHE